MNRHMWRFARRSVSASRNVPKHQTIVQSNYLEKTESSQASSSSQEHNILGWRWKRGVGYEQLQIVNALRLGKRERASKMLLNLGQASGSLGSDDFAYILNYCAEAPDPLFVMETWRLMEKKAIDVSKNCCRYIILAFIKGGYLKEAFNWLIFFGESDFAHALLPLYNIMLSECGNRQNFVDAVRCLELMEGRLMGKSEKTYCELLKLAVLQKNLSAVHDLWKDCISHYSPSIVTLRKFVWSFTRLGDLESAYKVLQHMLAFAAHESDSIRLSTVGKCQSSRLDIPIPSVNDLPYKIFELRGSTCSLNFLIEATKDSQGVLGEIFQDQSKEENHSLHNTAESPILGECILNLPHGNHTSDVSLAGNNGSNVVEKDGLIDIDMESTSRQGPEVSVLKEGAPVKVEKLLLLSFNNLIHASALAKNYKLVEHLFLQMHDHKLEPSPDTYDGLVKAAIYGKGVAYGMKVVEFMMKRNIKPYNDTFAALSTAHSKILQLDIAEAFLEKISDSQPKYIIPFNMFLVACDVMDVPERAVRILAKLKHLNIKPNIRTYENLFSLFCTVNVPYEDGNILSHVDVSKRVNVIEKDMIRRGVQHSYTSMTNLIRALGAEGMIEEMLRYLSRAENALENIDSCQRSDMYNIVLHALVKAKDTNNAIEVFKTMRLYGFPASVATYSMMIECCSILSCFKSACGLVSIMIRDGFYPQTLTYTSLIKVLLANDDFDQALSLMDQAISEGNQLDIILFNAILKQAYSKGRIDIIELIVEHIHREKIRPDPSTCCYTFSAYVENGFFSTGMEALQVLSLRMISKEDNRILDEQKAAFEDLVCSEDSDVELRIVEIFEGSQEYIATGLLSLRWCAINGVSLTWSPEESLWAKRLSNSFDLSRRKT
ncbi:pentatricopeptide repeat-containing protein isoform X1 [Iris pallida]|uniref:Pentatricopeptide repeat-containing protein isoform X1 n=1 Tax=Iris pallida TaxID=29817 RepID=A0AAX6EWT4_IRIPA|nr:pentatricopeptide repeat-containing protein isoform X1 [Iris pallida]